MESMEIVILLTALLAITVGTVWAVIKCAKFYKQRFGFSVFSGVIIMILVFVLLYYNMKDYNGKNLLMIILAFCATAFVVIRDIQLAKVSYGLGAFAIQTILALLSFFFIAVLLGLFLIRQFSRRQGRLSRQVFSPSFLQCFELGLLSRYFRL